MNLVILVLFCSVSKAFSHAIEDIERTKAFDTREADDSYGTPSPLAETDNGKREASAVANATGTQREKRFLFIAEFIGGFFAEYALNAGMEALEGFLGKEDPIEKLQASIDQLTESVEKLQKDVNKIGKNILNLQLTNDKNSFATTINNLHMLVSEEMSLLVKENLNDFEKNRQQGVINQILHQGNGIEIPLRTLHLTLIGKNNFPNKHIIETFYEKMMSGRETNPYKADSKLRSNVLLFMKYLLETQAIGFNVWYTAVKAKYRNDPGNLEFYQNDIKNKEKERLEEQKKYLAEKFFKPCKTISLPTYPGSGKSLSCSDGFNFGSICQQKCAGPCQNQKPSSTTYWYPPIGFPSVQCLLKGQWGKNVKDELRVACTFCPEDSSPKDTPPVPFQCAKYDRSSNNPKSCSAKYKVNVGLKTGKKCINGCSALKITKKSPFKAYKAWCYVDGKKWEFCLPEKVLRNPERKQNLITMKGKKCKGDCKLGKWFQYKDYYWCDKDGGGWDYCS